MHSSDLNLWNPASQEHFHSNKYLTVTWYANYVGPRGSLNKQSMSKLYHSTSSSGQDGIWPEVCILIYEA